MSLNGKIFAISGTLSQPRQHYVDFIAANGGVFSSSVTKKVNYLIVEDPTMSTAKIEKAKKDGTAIISEKELLGLSAGVAPVVASAVAPVSDTAKAAKPKAKATVKSEPAKVKQTKIVTTNVVKSLDLPLKGFTVAISGKLSKTKEQFADIITANGGTYAGTMTKKVTHIIAKETEGASAKLQKARKYGAVIVDESFLDGMTGKAEHTDSTKEQTETEAPPGVLLAQKYNPDKFPDGPKGWWISEKLDGVRCYWNGKQILSRVGNKFYAPQFFLDQLPKDHHLDGELFIDRGKFRETVSIVKSHSGGDRWKQLTFMVFDIPSSGDLPFEDRMALLNTTLNDGTVARPNVKIVEQTLYTGTPTLFDMLKVVEDKKGEGLMCRQPGSKYETKRSHTLLKVKTFFDDEAKVIGYATEGTGRLSGMTGSLRCINRAGVTFDCGSGLDDEMRKNPPEIGTIITYKYQELSGTSGKPRFPTFVGIAIDKPFP